MQVDPIVAMRLRDAFLSAVGLHIGPVWMGLAWDDEELVRRRVTPVAEVRPEMVVWEPVKFRLPFRIPDGAEIVVFATGLPAATLGIYRIETLTARYLQAGDSIRAQLRIGLMI